MEHLKIDGRQFYNMILNGSNKLEEDKEYVNALNVFPVPDGDTGTNMSMTFRAAATEIIGKENLPLGEVAKQLSRGALMGARGNSGVILSQIFRGIAKGLEKKDTATAREFALAIMEGARSAYKAVMRPTEGTILTIIRAAGDAAEKSKETDITKLLAEVCKASEDMLNKTPEMLPALKKANVVDAGGMGLLKILVGMHEALENDLNVSLIGEVSVKKPQETSGHIDETEITYGYCTEFFIVSDTLKPENFRREIESYGDSIIVVGADGLIKTHIHAEDPGKVLSLARAHGQLSKIKIENMREQHTQLIEMKQEASKEVITDIETKESKPYGFISVSTGKGIKNLFSEELGVDVVIEGGQTMNPSTQDFLSNIEKLNADVIYILPNNKNIIMAANQAAEIADKKVYVIPTKTIPQGVTALTTFNPEASFEDNCSAMEEAIKNVNTGSITFAVKNTEVDGKEIKEGNILGLVEGKIEEVGYDPYETCEAIIKNMVTEDSELISIYYGEDTDNDRVQELVEKLEEKYGDLDIISYEGNQPLYYFLISVE